MSDLQPNTPLPPEYPAGTPLVLFLCTGNIYRSRYAEAYFNHMAELRGLKWRAISRGLAIELAKGMGNISRQALASLKQLQIACPDEPRPPIQVRPEDLSSVAMIVALKEEEHRPLLTARCPGWENRVTYWHIHDRDIISAEIALVQIQERVTALIEELSPQGEGAPGPRIL